MRLFSIYFHEAGSHWSKGSHWTEKEPLFPELDRWLLKGT